MNINQIKKRIKNLLKPGSNPLNFTCALFPLCHRSASAHGKMKNKCLTKIKRIEGKGAIKIKASRSPPLSVCALCQSEPACLASRLAFGKPKRTQSKQVED